MQRGAGRVAGALHQVGLPPRPWHRRYSSCRHGRALRRLRRQRQTQDQGQDQHQVLSAFPQRQKLARGRARRVACILMVVARRTRLLPLAAHSYRLPCRSTPLSALRASQLEQGGQQGWQQGHAHQGLMPGKGVAAALPTGQSTAV